MEYTLIGVDAKADKTDLKDHTTFFKLYLGGYFQMPK